MANYLTTLNNLRQWIVPVTNPSSSLDNTLLQNLIARKSQEIFTYISRQTFFKNEANTVCTGNGGITLVLPQWPVIEVTQLKINNVVIPAAQNSTEAGWLLTPWDGFSVGAPQLLQLNGYAFGTPVSYGYPYMDGGSPYNSGFTRNQALATNPQNVDVNYITGYFLEDDPYTIPASVAYTVTPANHRGTWGQDDGVTLANGTPLTRVTGTPSTGQYAVSESGTTFGTYTFAAADHGLPVLISWSYIPPSIEDACIQMCAEAYSYKARVGLASQNLGGQTGTGYRQNGMTPDIQQLLQPYKRMMLKR